MALSLTNLSENFLDLRTELSHLHVLIAAYPIRVWHQVLQSKDITMHTEIACANHAWSPLTSEVAEILLSNLQIYTSRDASQSCRFWCTVGGGVRKKQRHRKSGDFLQSQTLETFQSSAINYRLPKLHFWTSEIWPSGKILFQVININDLTGISIW